MVSYRPGTGMEWDEKSVARFVASPRSSSASALAWFGDRRFSVPGESSRRPIAHGGSDTLRATVNAGTSRRRSVCCTPIGVP
jgi:hypothetical protein